MAQTDKRNLTRGVLFSIAAAALPMSAKADAGIPMIAFSYPIMIGLLVFVILIEAAYFRRQVKASWKASLLSLGKANLLTTIAGFPLMWLTTAALEIGFFFLLSKLLASNNRYDRVLATTPGQVLGTILSAPWLGPTESKLAIITAFITLLVPAFFLSGWIEARVVSADEWNENESAVRKAVWRANLLSYVFLAVAGALILQLELRH